MGEGRGGKERGKGLGVAGVYGAQKDRTNMQWVSSCSDASRNSLFVTSRVLLLVSDERWEGTPKNLSK